MLLLPVRKIAPAARSLLSHLPSNHLQCLSCFYRSRCLGVFVACFDWPSVPFTSVPSSKTPTRPKIQGSPASSRIEVTVLRASKANPLRAPAVIFHPIEGERDTGGMELKTSEDGKAVIDVIPIGDTVRLQVIAKGFQTYGKDFKVDRILDHGIA